MSEYGVITCEPFQADGLEFHGMEVRKVHWHNGMRFLRFLRDGRKVETPLSPFEGPNRQRAVDAVRNTFDYFKENEIRA